MARPTGLGTEVSTLLRPTVPTAEVADAPDVPPDDAETDGDAEGRGENASGSRPAPPRTRRKRAAPVGKTKARNLHLSDDVHDRLWQLARHRKTTVSAVANEMLDKALPRWKVERQG